MKKLIVVTAILALLVGASFGDGAITDYRGSIGYVKTDTMRWFASGAILGSGGVRVDTLVAGTLSDTTYAMNIAGAEAVSVEIISQGIEDDCDFTIYAQVGQSALKTAAWHTILKSYSVDNTKGSQIGGVDNTAKDSTMWVMLPRAGAFPDTSVGHATQVGMTINSQIDQYMIANGQFVRLIVDPDASAGDTTYVTAIATISYPR